MKFQRLSTKQHRLCITSLGLIALLLLAACGNPAGGDESNYSESNTPVVAQVIPRSGATTFVDSPTISWEEADGVTSYQLQIAATAADMEYADAQDCADASFTPSDDLNDDQQYFWRYRTVTTETVDEVDTDTYGDWSDTYNFTKVAVSSDGENEVKYPFELVYLGENSTLWGYSYAQMNDIDMDGESYTAIGNSSTSFTGSYDGNGYEIANLSISATTAYQGMFGYSVDATLTDIHLKEISISSSEPHVGGLAGYLRNATVSISSVSGDIVCTPSNENYALVGGLIGYMRGTSVTECWFVGTVNGSESEVGGLISEARYANTISNCYSRPTSVTGTSYVGGFVGKINRYSSGYTLTVQNCYSAAQAISGSSSVYGFSGSYSVTSATGLFFDSSLYDGSDSKATGTSTTNMKTTSTFTNAGWDFVGETANGSDDVWKRQAGINDGYPYLVNNPPR